MKELRTTTLTGPKRWLFVALCSGVMWTTPSRTEKTTVKFFAKGMTIQASRRDPPRIAFNEILSLNQKPSLENKVPAPEIDLNTKIDEKVGLHSIQWIKSRKVVLKPMIFTKPVETANIASQSWLDELSPQQKMRVDLAQLNDRTLESDWSPPTRQQNLLAQVEKVKSQIALDSAKLSAIYVSATQRDGTEATIESIRNGDVQVKTPAPTHAVVQGKIRLQEGLGLGQGYIDVRLVQNGVSLSAGKVDTRKGTYEITSENYNGTLIASLISEKGEKLGEGSLRLSQVSPLRFGTSDIVLTPVQNKVAVHYVDFSTEVSGKGKKNHYDDRGLPARAFFASLDSEQKANSAGDAKMDNVVKGSWSLVRSDLSKYQETLHLVQAGAENRTVLFKKSFTRALLSIAKEQQNASYAEENGSIVWGQVKMDSKPVSGVKIEAENQTGYQVIYFNTLMLPDVGLKATGENGYFAILHLPEGMHALVATRGDQYFSHINVAVEPDVISPVELLGSTHLEPVEVKVFDAFEGSARMANLEIQSLPAAIDVNGAGQIYLPQVERLSLMKVEPEDVTYLPTQMNYRDTQDSLHVPLLRDEWIRYLRASNKIDDSPNSVLIAGFVQDESFDVYLSHFPDFPRHNILYFNSQGEIVESGVAGGGFLIFNVPPGIQSVVVASKTSSMLSSQVIPTDIGIVSTLHFHF